MPGQVSSRSVRHSSGNEGDCVGRCVELKVMQCNHLRVVSPLNPTSPTRLLAPKSFSPAISCPASFPLQPTMMGSKIPGLARPVRILLISCLRCCTAWVMDLRIRTQKVKGRVLKALAKMPGGDKEDVVWVGRTQKMSNLAPPLLQRQAPSPPPPALCLTSRLAAGRNPKPPALPQLPWTLPLHPFACHLTTNRDTSAGSKL